MSDPRVWFITGASSGFGHALTTAALAHGDRVVSAARRPESVPSPDRERQLVVTLDVTDPAQRTAAIESALERFGRIDVLVNNAGRTMVGAVEETSDEELRMLFDLHVFAPAALTRLVLPVMRRQGGGAIVQMSSVGGQVTAPGFGAYCATKFALEGLTQALRDEVAGFGIHTLLVEPGAFRTSLFQPGSAYESGAIAAYGPTVGPTRAYLRSGDGTQAGDPAKAAEAIIEALGAPEPPLRLALGDDAVDGIRAQLAGRVAELDRWEDLSRATALDDPS